MSTIGKRTIYAGPADGANHKPAQGEAVATEAGILPGMILARAAANAGVEISDTAATVFGVQTMVANRNYLLQKTVDEAWTADENMNFIYPRSGEYINQLVATGQALVVGTALTRAAGGLLTIAATDGTEEIVAYSDEIVTTTASQLVRVRYA